MRKSSFGKAFAAISGAAKPARELVARLGLSNEPAPADELTRLAAHVSSIYAFEDDGAAADLLGASWDGLNTKFDQIAFGIKARQYFVEQIGPDLTRRLIEISPEGVRNLHQFEGAANSARKTVAKLGRRLDDRSIDLTIGMLADEIATMQCVLAVDPEGSLSELTAPVRELAEIAALYKEPRPSPENLDGSPLKYAVEELSRMPGGIDDAFASIDWLAALRRLTVPAFLLNKLSSSGAPDAWRRTSAIAAKAQADLQAHDDQQKLLEGEFGIMTPLPGSSQPSFRDITSELLDHRDELRELLGL